MSLKIERATREFRYNGIPLTDPNPAMTAEQVRDFYANVYPEIVSAAIEGPEAKGAKAVYTFRRAVGTKGATPRTRPAAGNSAVLACLDAIDADTHARRSRHRLSRADLDDTAPIADAWASFVSRNRRRNADAITLPADLVPLLP